MKKFIKPACLLFYFLSFIVFFFVGILFAGITNAAEGQGLAGGAIVLGYGVIFGFLTVLASFILIYLLPVKSIIKINWILFMLFLIVIVALTLRILTRKNSKSSESTVPFKTGIVYYVGGTTITNDFQQKTDKSIGLGFFKPNFHEIRVIYFYNNPFINKSRYKHVTNDSIVFKQTNNGFEISYAPPWLQPDHLKLDYDMLFFRVQSVGTEYAEITVNTTKQQTAYIKRSEGEIIYWPDFLLCIHSVEMLPDKLQKVRIKPLDYAAEVSLNFDFMKPMLIKNEWMLVELQDKNFRQLENGWIKWKNDNQLLISYSLLS